MTDGMWLDVEILIGGKPIENQVPYELAYRVAMDVAGGSAQFYDWMNHDFDGLGRECYDAIIAD